MKNVIKYYNNNLFQDSENLYLYFTLGESKYALNIGQVVEIMKLPLLDYPKKLDNNIIGLLNYNNFTINVLDIRFYLGIPVTPYSISNQLLIAKTDESIFGLVIDKVEDIISMEQSQVDSFPFSGEERIIDFLHKKGNETISGINLNSIEALLKKGCQSVDIDIQTLFPHDDDSRYKFVQRNQALVEKFESNLITNAFAQDKFISFSLGDNIYCINLEYLKEFLKNTSITHMPCDLDYIEGVITLRGDFISVINLKKFLNFDMDILSTDYTESKNNIIVIDAFDYKIGFLVDEIFDIIDIPEELVTKNYHTTDKYILSELVMEDKLYTILNMKNILSDERLFVEEIT